MDRRSAISMISFLLGSTMIGADLILHSGCKATPKKVTSLFDTEDVKLLDEVAETILPKTNTPGAKDASMGSFMATMVTDCYFPKDQKIFMQGIKKIDEISRQKFSNSFMDCSSTERFAILQELDVEVKKYLEIKKPEDPHHFFRMMKELTIFGFFTSEPGATKVLRYVAIPGKYLGDVPYKKGDRAWATY